MVQSPLGKDKTICSCSFFFTFFIKVSVGLTFLDHYIIL